MQVEVYFVSTVRDLATPRSFFKLPFLWDAIPPKGSETAVPVQIGERIFVLKGVLQDVRVTDNLGKALFGTEMPPQDMREAVLPGRCRLTELAQW